MSIKTLHHYDKIGLLKPLKRTEARYRLYGETELLRLQQILFYKELDFPLQEIMDLMDDPEYDMLTALTTQKAALIKRQKRITTLIATLDKTINHQLNKNTFMKPEELYEGLPKETAKTYREEAIKAYGKDAIETSEKSLMKLSKKEMEALKQEQKDVTNLLFSLKEKSHEAPEVQAAIQKHYEITRKFWGTSNDDDPQLEQYAGLGDLYVADERFTRIDGVPQPDLGQFLKLAMRYFADRKQC